MGRRPGHPLVRLIATQTDSDLGWPAQGAAIFFLPSVAFAALPLRAETGVGVARRSAPESDRLRESIPGSG